MLCPSRVSVKRERMGVVSLEGNDQWVWWCIEGWCSISQISVNVVVERNSLLSFDNAHDDAMGGYPEYCVEIVI